MDFPTSPSNDTAEILRRDTANALRTITSVGQAVLLKNISVAAASTAVSHGLRVAPRAFFAIPQADARVWRSATPDASNVYVQANIASTCDILIIP